MRIRQLIRRLGGAALLTLAIAATLAAGPPPSPAAPGAGADPLPGRLFHTPAERAQIDSPAPPGPLRPPARPQRRSSPEQSPALSGFVLRSDGHNSYWLQSTPTPAGNVTQ